MNVEQINLISNKIIKYKNLIRCLKEELENSSEYIKFHEEIENYGFYGNSLGEYEIGNIYNNIKFHQSQSDKDNVRVTIEHTSEYQDQWSEFETDVTNVVIYADIKFTDEEIESKKVEKLAEIERLESEVIRLEEELKGMIYK